MSDRSTRRQFLDFCAGVGGLLTAVVTNPMGSALSQPAVANDTVYVPVSESDTLHRGIVALDAQTGTRRWSFSPRTGLGSFSAVAIAGSTLFTA
ncbi:twin-arginine translocation signal domain-containing protein [Halocatena halophila]|uniref:twin-arginine translocation signal domain-containing protein n=1 Tax=Halocatena halophila TaxID=2814576 RepID=UPI002ED03DFF